MSKRRKYKRNKKYHTNKKPKYNIPKFLRCKEGRLKEEFIVINTCFKRK
jgi:hypothetical protein